MCTCCVSSVLSWNFNSISIYVNYDLLSAPWSPSHHLIIQLLRHNNKQLWNIFFTPTTVSLCFLLYPSIPQVLNHLNKLKGVISTNTVGYMLYNANQEIIQCNSVMIVILVWRLQFPYKVTGLYTSLNSVLLTVNPSSSNIPTQWKDDSIL